jgi:hypothetical protein
MAQFDAIPDAPVFDAVPDAPEFDAVPDDVAPEVVAQEAQRASTGAVQALDVMAAPARLDWSEVNEHLDDQRLQESRAALARAEAAEAQGSGTGPGSEAFNWRREADFQRERISPDTAAGRLLAQEGQTQLQEIEEVGTTDARNASPTPSQALGSFLGSGLSQTVQPVIESGARNLGGAGGGGLGAALAAAATVGTGGFAPLALGIGMSMLGGYAGSAAQEQILETTETPEETQGRQQRAAEDFARNPGLSRIGAAAAGLPLFGPSLAQFGRAAAGDRGALLNLGMAGGIGAGVEAGAAKFVRGEEVKPEDVAVAFFSNMILNEPTKLGRKLGLRPSSEQQAVEAAQTKYGGIAPDPEIAGAIARVGESGVTNRGTTSTADVFSGVQRPPQTSRNPYEGFEWKGEDVGAQLQIAVKTPDGRVITDPAARIHAQLVQSLGLDREKRLTPGFIIRDEFVPGSQTNPQAIKEARQRIEARIAASEPAAPPEETTLAPDPVAQPVEDVVETPSPETTSIQNAVTADERAARGIDPVEEPARRSFGEVWDTTKAEIAENPAAPDAILAELRKKPRALTDREDALILHRQVQLQKSFDAAAAEANQAMEAGDEPARVDAMAQLDRTREALDEVYTLGKQAGTETARGLAARKMMSDLDFNLASMETRLRAEQGGALTPEQQVKVKEQADTIAKTQEGMDRILAEREVQKAEAEADKAVDPKVKSLADRIIARLDLTAKNAATSLRSRLNNLGSGPDPLIVLDVAKIAAAKTVKGAIEFAQWSAEMVKEFGEKVRPFLQAGWDQREQHVDSEVNASTRKGKTAKTDAEKEAAAVKARLTSLANRTAEYQRRAATGDFSPMRKPALDLSKNPEWVKLKAENEAAKAAYDKSRYEARKAQRTTQQKINDTVADVFSAARPILASTDISAPGRQGIFFTLPDLFMNPVRLGRQLKSMFRSQFSETKFQQNEAAIKSRENADLYESSDLYLADIDHKPSAREEQFKSELAEKIPGIGRVVRGSSRGFSAFMNTVRADAMDAFVKWSGGKENIDPETAKFLAAAINDLSGRGNVSSRQAQGALEWLAKYLFSPRLWVSRFNTATLKPIWRDPLNTAISPRARAVVAVQYIKFAGALMALKWLAGLNGGKMEEDPRDSDFGKLQFGSKRYDVMGGIGNMVTLLARIATRKTKDDKGKVVRIAWSGEKRPERELGQILFNHIRNKAAPIPGTIYDWFYGRHPDRSKVTPTSMLKQTTVPITVSDTFGYFQKDNPASAARDTLINALGVSVQDYRK